MSPKGRPGGEFLPLGGTARSAKGAPVTGVPMKRWQRAALQVVGALAALAIAQGGAAQERKSYAFSPVNQYGIALTAAYWNPILEYVSARSGVPLTLKIGRTSADTTSYVLANEVEFVFSNHLFSPEREKMGWQVIGRRDAPPIKAELVVPADSPITTIAELAGRDVSFPGPEAFVAYKVPYAHLLAKGIAINVVFGGNMDAALTQLFAGKVQAVGGNSQLIEGFAKRENRKYRVLWASEPYHDLALMASGKVPERDRRAVAAAFAGMAGDPKGREILRTASQAVGLPTDSRFIASDGSEYASYRRFYETAPAQLR
jgi:phosphonate transport system substrate-binding protein